MSIPEDILCLLVLLTAPGCGLNFGIFVAFSSFVMKSLARIPAKSGLGALQAINEAVLNPLFLIVFPGTALGSILLIVAAFPGISRSALSRAADSTSWAHLG